MKKFLTVVFLLVLLLPLGCGHHRGRSANAIYNVSSIINIDNWQDGRVNEELAILLSMPFGNINNLPYHWSVQGLPPGLDYVETSGSLGCLIYGVPTVRGTWNIKILVANSNNQAFIEVLPLKVN